MIILLFPSVVIERPAAPEPNEWHHVDRASDWFHRAFLNFGIFSCEVTRSAERERYWKPVAWLHLAEGRVTLLICIWEEHAKKKEREKKKCKSNQTKPISRSNTEEQASRNRQRAEAQHGICEYALVYEEEEEENRVN